MMNRMDGLDTSSRENSKALSNAEYVQAQCEQYNSTPGTLNEVDGYDCRICKNRGYTAEVRTQELFGYPYQVLIPCRCKRTRAMIRKLQRSGLKNVVKDYTFEKYIDAEPWQKTLKQAAMQFCDDDAHEWFFIGGAVGCGKSHLCSAIAVSYLRKDVETKYMLWRDDIVKIKASVTDSQEYADAINALKKVPVLYIDDLFKTGRGGDGRIAMPTAADINIAFEVLNYRYNQRGLVTIISSERTLQELVDIDEAIASRIAERSVRAGYGFSVKPDRNKNYRMKGAVEL